MFKFNSIFLGTSKVTELDKLYTRSYYRKENAAGGHTQSHGQ